MSGTDTGSETESRSGPGFRLTVEREEVTLPNGRVVTLDMVRHPGAAAVAPFPSENEVVLIHQHRHAADGRIYEVPAGKLDPGELPATCAARELEEEAGLRAGRLVDLGWIWTTPGFTDEKIHLFAAFDLTPVPTRLEADEHLVPLRVPFDEALELVWRGELRDAKSSLALLHAARVLGRLG